MGRIITLEKFTKVPLQPDKSIKRAELTSLVRGIGRRNRVDAGHVYGFQRYCGPHERDLRWERYVSIESASISYIIESWRPCAKLFIYIY